MTPDDDELARLLSSARQADLPDRARLARIKSQLLPGGLAGVPEPSATQLAAKSALSLKVAAGLSLVVVAAVTYLQVQRPPPPAAHAPAPQTQVTPPPPSAAAPELPPVPHTSDAGQMRPALEHAGAPAAAPAPAPTRVRRRPPVQPAQPTQPAQPAQREPAPKPVVSTLSEETALLRMATLAAHAGRLTEAREALARFDRTFPNSQLKSERDRLLRYITERERVSPAR